MGTSAVRIPAMGTPTVRIPATRNKAIVREIRRWSERDKEIARER
jgi:hypothetical protein